MAFTTIQGSGAAATTIVGTSGVDFSTVTTIDNYFIGAQEGADTIGVNANLTNGTIKGGQGTDTISFDPGSSVTSSFVNSNANNDTFGAAGAGANFFSSTVLGGQGLDQFNLGTVTESSVNGNKQNDTFVAGATLTTATVFGGQGDDTVNATAAATGSVISGDLGSDTLTLGAGNHNSNSVNGGDGVDTINLTAGAAGTTFNNNTINGGDGNDSIQGNVAMIASTGTIVNGDAGIDTIAFGNAAANTSNFTQALTINGGADGDIITSGLGADVVSGDAGADTIENITGNDTISGGTGADTITDGTAGNIQLDQSTGDSLAATVAWTNVGGANGFLTDVNSVLTFGNGVDVVQGFDGGGNDTVDVDVAAVTALAAATDIRTIAAGGYLIRGNYQEGTGSFSLNAAGADALYIETTGGSLATAANNGTTSAVFVGGGAAMVVTDFI